jgi:trans-2,3-dihydro-3-hydroxyanthranilate isomerase
MVSAGTPPQELNYQIVDVFSETALEANPLAVVFDTVGLPTTRMQAIAREFNLSETTFIQRRDSETEKREGVRVRIFTAEEELPFAGHPTLGTASVLKLSAPETISDGVITLALNVGPVPVRFTGSGLYGEMTQKDPEFGDQLDAATVAQLIGLSVEDLHSGTAPQVVSTGTAFAIVTLRSHEALARLKVDQEKATKYLREHGGRWFYVLGPTGGDAPAWRARMQFYGGEDPATGSAAGCAISYLVRYGMVAPGRQIHVRQGVEIGRPSDLFLAAELVSGKVGNVRVGGSTVRVAKGQLFLP